MYRMPYYLLMLLGLFVFNLGCSSSGEGADSSVDNSSEANTDADSDSDSDSDSDTDSDTDSDSDSDSDTDTDTDSDTDGGCAYECLPHCMSWGGTQMDGVCDNGLRCCEGATDPNSTTDIDTDTDTDTDTDSDTDTDTDTDADTDLGDVNCTGSTLCVDINSEKQVIRGFGGINHPVWIGDLTAAQRETAFGNGPDQLGFTVLRLFISDNSRDWSKDFETARRAQELGALIFASPWNPPANMATTINGEKHVNPSMYAEYAAHLTDYYNTMTNEGGIDLYSVSIQNEPDYAHDWTWWSADELVNFLKTQGPSLPFRVMAPESFQYRKVMSDPILNDPAALENMDILGAHLYGTQVRDFPYPLFKQKGAGKELWMTEVYVPNSDENSADRWPEALEVAQHIHNAMVEAEFQAYVWWYIRRQYGPMKEDGRISKRGYCMAQYSKFVRSGYVRVDVSGSPGSDVYVSAYKGPSDVVIVVVNKSTSSQTLTFSVPSKTTSFEKYTTSSSKNATGEGEIAAANGTLTVEFDGQSATTLVGAAQ
jgi:glucuronoarabinoxylan endo-1,4-beta-xylanase